MTATGRRTCRLAMLSGLAAPVSCSAIRKSEACRTPGARPLAIPTMVGRPAPAQSAMWSKPSSKALSMVIVPPKRTPPNILNSPRRSSSRRTTLEEVLVPADGDPVLGDAAKAGHGARTQRLLQLLEVAHRLERRPGAEGVDAGDLGRQRLDLQPVDRHHGVAVVDQMVGEREAGRAQTHHQHSLAARRAGQRPLEVERVPAAEQRIDLEAPGQGQHVLQHPGLDLGNVHRLLLLEDARLHAVVADAVAGGGDHRIVDDGDGQRADGQAAGRGQVHLRDFLFQRAAGEDEAPERAFS